MRLFFALVPPEPIMRQLLLCQGGVSAARWQDASQLHLTVRYLGKVDRHIADMLITMAEREQWLCPPVTLNGMGYFQHKGRIDQIWAGVAPRDGLLAMHNKLDAMAVRCGLPPEHHKFIPHITIARLSAAARGAEAFVAGHSDLMSEPFVFNRLIMFESMIGHKGASYQPIAEWPVAEC